jgi:hypothetical protein
VDLERDPARHPEGLLLIDTANHTVIDARSYPGSITAANLSTLGFLTTVSLVEGTVLPTSVADSGAPARCVVPPMVPTRQRCNRLETLFPQRAGGSESMNGRMLAA